MDDKTPPRTLGILLALLGAALLIGGLTLLKSGGIYFVLAGVGVAISGMLIASGRLIGAYIYGATILVLVVWSVIEVGMNPQQLLPRIMLPIIIGLYLFSGRVRSRLA